MIDVGNTSPYVLLCLDVCLQYFEYLGVDWESDLGKLLHEIMVSVNDSLPDIVVINEPDI